MTVALLCTRVPVLTSVPTFLGLDPVYSLCEEESLLLGFKAERQTPFDDCFFYLKEGTLFMLIVNQLIL